MYTKGERVLRIEMIVHNTQALRCGRRLERFPQIVVRLHDILEQFLGNVYCMDAAFISDETLNQLPDPSRVGKTRVEASILSKNSRSATDAHSYFGRLRRSACRAFWPPALSAR